MIKVEGEDDVRAGAGNGGPVVDHVIVGYTSRVSYVRGRGRDMRTVNEGEATLARDVAHDRLQALEVGRVEGTSHTRRGWAYALHQEWNAEGVKSLAHKVLWERNPLV